MIQLERTTRIARASKGASVLSYGLLLGLISVVCLAALDLLGDSVDLLFDRTVTALDEPAILVATPTPSASATPLPCLEEVVSVSNAVIGQAVSVPHAECATVEILAWGAGGGGGSHPQATGGGGAFVTATLAILPSDSFLVTVGEGGSSVYSGSGSTGGAPGGAASGDNTNVGQTDHALGAGGGYSAVSHNGNEILVVGAGGGAGVVAAPYNDVDELGQGAPGGALVAESWDDPINWQLYVDNSGSVPARSGQGGNTTTMTPGAGAQPARQPTANYDEIQLLERAGAGGDAVGRNGGIGGTGANNGGGGGGGGYFGGGGGLGTNWLSGGGGGGSSWVDTGYVDLLSSAMEAGTLAQPGNASHPLRGESGDGGVPTGGSILDPAFIDPGSDGRVILIFRR